MVKISRRSVLGGAIGAAAASTLARPYIANAQAKTAVYWAGQGFIPQEDAAMRKVCEDYMKESGNKLDYSLMPFMALNQKTISALTSGDVPDLIFMDAPETILPQNAWDDKVVDVTDVVAPFESQLSETAKLILDLLQQGDQEAQLLHLPDQAGRHAVPHLGRSGREGRAQDGGNPEELGRDLDLSQADAGAAAFQGNAEDLRLWSADHHGRTERRQ